MKKITTLVLSFLLSSLMVVWAQTVPVTFQVDMSNVVEVSPMGVHVAGSFQSEIGASGDWIPGETQLNDAGSGIYSLTVDLPAGTYEFKYLNGNSWGTDESVPGDCAVNGNRQLIVGNELVVLDPVCFGSCDACTIPIDVTFRVDMSNEAEVSPLGVHVAGSFQSEIGAGGDWIPEATELTEGDPGIYSITVQLPAGTYEFKYLNGNSWGTDETVPAGCAFNGNRQVVVETEPVVLDAVCFASCVPCEAPTVDVTFQVDMNNEEIDANGVHIAGSFQDPVWEPGSTSMTDAGNGVFTYTTAIAIGESVEYKFVNGNSWGQEESVPGECAVNGNRVFNVPDYNVVIDIVCFGACDICNSPTDELFISEYYEGSFGNNKYIEIYNGTGAPVDFSQYRTHRIGNGGTWDENIYTYEEGTIIQPGDVFVIANDGSMQQILDSADVFNGTAWFNGDDAVGMSKLVDGEWIMIDAIGEEGADPGSGWDVAGTNNATANHTLVRKTEICAPNMDWESAAGTDENDSEWIVYPANTLDYLGFHSHICGGSPITATPSLSASSGLYFEAISLEITCTTPGATIFYTTDGSDPDQSSEIYVGPINVSEDGEIKAMAVALGHSASMMSSAAYTFELATPVANLAELRSMLGGDADYYKIEGDVVLTFQQSFRGQKFIQDATAGVLIDDNSGVITSSYNRYDGISGLIGTISEFGGMIQFVPAIDPGPATSSGNVIVPEVLTLSEFTQNFEDYESELVQILDVSFANAGTTFSNGNEYPISDASKGEGVFRTTFFSVDYIGSTIPPVEIGITGIGNSRDEGDFITARDFDDLLIPDYVIVTAPNGGEQVEQGAEYEITWETNMNNLLLTIELVSPNKAVEVLAEDVDIADGSFTWTVTQAYGDEYKISIYSDETKLLGDESDDFFSIVPPIDIKITEIMYNSPESGTDTLEFVEFYNNGDGVLNLLDWQVTKGFSFTFPEHTLNPGEYVVTCYNAEAFLNTFGMVAYEWASGGLSNGGEEIELIDSDGTVRANVDFVDGWYPLTDGDGPSLTFCDPTLDNNDEANWSASTKFAAINAAGKGIYCTPGNGCNEAMALPMYYSDGWTTMSSYVDPGELTMEEVFAPTGSMVILINHNGIFWPGFNVNTIGNWDAQSGYKVKFDDDTYFVFSGEELGNKTYAFTEGTFYVPILSEEPATVSGLIEPLGDAVEFMFDLNSGNVYWPEGEITPGSGAPTALETLTPGYAYLTKFNSSGEINFGADLPKANPVVSEPFENTTPWNDVMATGEQHILSISKNALQSLQRGDVIGAFNNSGICVGMAAYDGSASVLPMVVYGDDFTTEATDGMLEGENLNFKVYRMGETLDLSAVYNMNIQNHDGKFALNGLSVIEAFKLGATGIVDQNQAYSIYPNPGNGEFNIDVVGDFVVNVTNAQGQVIFAGKISGNSVINLSDQPEGIYFIRLTGDTSSMIEKVIVK